MIPRDGWAPRPNHDNSGMTSPSSDSTRRYALPLVVAYPLLAIAGVITRWPLFPLLALALLLTAPMLPRLFARQPVAWLCWLLMLGALGMLSLLGFVELLLQCIPVLINALLAYWFGRTLPTSRPLVARFIAAIEGEERLTMPGISDYARHLTWFWTLLMAAQALMMSVLLVCAEHIGLLARFGLHSPLPIPERLAAVWLHLGSYLLLGAAFVLEYGFRRWHLRHLRHPGLHDMVMRLSANWPQLLRGNGEVAP